MRVGVVLVGSNCRDLVEETLRSIVPLGCPVIYVDMASIDDSVDLARRAGASVREMRIDQPISRTRACNEGAVLLMRAHPHLEVIQFLRVGCYLHAGWPKRAEKAFDEHPRLGALAGLSIAEGRKGKERLMFAEAVQGFMGELNGGDFAVRASILRKLKGFATVPRLGFETDFIVRAKHEGFFSRRIDERMLRVDSRKVRDFTAIRPSYRQGYIQYYLIFKAPTLAGRMGFLLRTVWVSFWTLWLPILIVVMVKVDSPYWSLAALLYGFLYLGSYLRRRYRIRRRETYRESLFYAGKMVCGFWSRMWGHLKAFRDLGTEETQKIFSKKKRRRN